MHEPPLIGVSPGPFMDIEIDALGAPGVIRPLIVAAQFPDARYAGKIGSTMQACARLK